MSKFIYKKFGHTLSKQFNYLISFNTRYIELELSGIFDQGIIKRVSWFKSSLLLRIKTVDITNINS